MFINGIPHAVVVRFKYDSAVFNTQKRDEFQLQGKKTTNCSMEGVVLSYPNRSMANCLRVRDKIASYYFDLYYTKDKLGNPLRNDCQVPFLGLFTQKELIENYHFAEDVNTL